MKRIIFYDTETTGLINYKAPLFDENQPTIVQIAAIVTTETGEECAALKLMVNPGTREVCPEAEAATGISTELARSLGVDLEDALFMWRGLYKQAETAIAHNERFDFTIMSIAHKRAGTVTSRAWDNKAHPNRLCTMKMATPILNLPPTEKMIKAGIKKPKSPKLSECVQFFFKEELEGAHDALIDVRACARVYFEMKRNYI